MSPHNNLPMQLRWSDLDPNFHVRHSVYYDWGATARIETLMQNGLTEDLMKQYAIGPILFREECVFRKEIRWGDRIYIATSISKVRKDCSRFSMRHAIYKNDTVLSAIIHVDGAWLQTTERKLMIPPPAIAASFMQIPRSEDFTWDETVSKTK